MLLELLVMVAAGPLVLVQVVSKIGWPGLASVAVPVRVSELVGKIIMVSWAGAVLTDTVGPAPAIADTEKKMLKIVI